MLEGWADFLSSILNMFTNALETLILTADRIDSITFDNSIPSQYLGYARFVLGDTFYILFTSVVLIALGITLWSIVVKGVNYIRGII